MSTIYSVPLKMKGLPVGTAVIRDDGDGNIVLSSVSIVAEHAQAAFWASSDNEYSVAMDSDESTSESQLGGKETTP